MILQFNNNSSYLQQEQINIYSCLLTMSKSLQSKPITRNQTAEIQIFSNRKLKFQKKHQGNSQFIKSKFDVDYNPKYRVIKNGKSPYSKSDAQKKQIQRLNNQEIQLLVHRAQQQVKNGKKLIIDWEQQNNFRTTRFPSIGEKALTNKKYHTQSQIVQSLSFTKKHNYPKLIDSFSNSPIEGCNKQIVSKSLHLQNLLSQSILEKKKQKKKLLRKFKPFSIQGSTLQLSQENSSMNISKAITQTSQYKDPHFNYSIIEEVQQKRKQFFEKNHEKIIAAIDFQKQMNIPLSSQKKQSSKKQKCKFEQIQCRIVCKSKLTILKSDLARKFKQIRQGLFDQIPMSGTNRKSV